MSELAKIFEGAVQKATNPEDILIVCDCDGTLWNGRGEFNTPLFLWLFERQREGFEIVIFSAATKDSAIAHQSNLHFGKPDVFLNKERNVTPKNEMDGVAAFLVIDDDHKSHKVKAKHRWNPNDPAVIAYIYQSLKRPVRPMPPGML